MACRCYCLCCRAEMELPRSHTCQQECDPYRTPKTHRDFCSRCAERILVSAQPKPLKSD